MKRIGYMLLATLALAACGGSDSTDPGSNGNGSAFDVTIGSGRNPTYTWPGGGAFSVSVVRVSAPTTIVWGLANPVTQNIASPVTHGTNPGGSTLVSTNAEPTLTTGIAYRVSITRADQKTGYKDFTP